MNFYKKKDCNISNSPWVDPLSYPQPTLRRTRFGTSLSSGWDVEPMTTIATSSRWGVTVVNAWDEAVARERSRDTTEPARPTSTYVSPGAATRAWDAYVASRPPETMPIPELPFGEPYGYGIDDNEGTD